MGEICFNILEIFLFVNFEILKLEFVFNYDLIVYISFRRVLVKYVIIVMV